MIFDQNPTVAVLEQIMPMSTMAGRRRFRVRTTDFKTFERYLDRLLACF